MTDNTTSQDDVDPVATEEVTDPGTQEEAASVEEPGELQPVEGSAAGEQADAAQEDPEGDQPKAEGITYTAQI